MTKPFLLSDLGVIQVTGDDQLSYLQGQLTCDLQQLGEQGWLAGCHCDAKGKMWSNFVLLASDDGILLVMHQAVLPASLAALQKFGVFAKVEINDLSEQLSVYGLLAGDTVNEAVATANLPFGQLFVTAESVEQSTDSSNWQLAQIRAGWPLLANADQVSEFVPQMLNQASIGAISFKKGCYIGQETVARMQYLGKQKRATFYLTAESADKLGSLDNWQVQISRGDNWRKAGNLVNAVVDDKGKLHLLAVLASDASDAEQYRLYNEQQGLELALTLQALPYVPVASDGDE